MISTFSNDSWASFFNFNFDLLLMNSCHCSFSLSSRKHHAFSSSSSSRTSSLMSHLSSSAAFRLLFQLFLDAFCRNVSCIPTAPANSGVCHLCHLSLAPFLLSCLRSWTSPFPARFTPCSPLPLLKCFSTLQLGPFPPFHSPLAPIPLYTACSKNSHVFQYHSSNGSSPSVPAAMSISIGALVSIFFSLDTERVVTLSMTMFSTAMINSSYGNVVPWSRQFSKL